MDGEVVIMSEEDEAIKKIMQLALYAASFIWSYAET